MSLFNDLFGGGGSHNQGEATSDGAGDGAKGRQILDFLSEITGAYDAITGSGENGGPAPATQVAKPAMNYLLIGGLALAAVALLFLFKRK